jgi:hypothetical protein
MLSFACQECDVGGFFLSRYCYGDIPVMYYKNMLKLERILATFFLHDSPKIRYIPTEIANQRL